MAAEALPPPETMSAAKAGVLAHYPRAFIHYVAENVWVVVEADGPDCIQCLGCHYSPFLAWLEACMFAETGVVA